MQIELRRAIPLTEEAVADFEVELGSKLPDRFRKFVAEYNGAKPTSNFYDDDVNVRFFLPLHTVIKEKQEYLYDTMDNTIPIAESAGGCYVLLKLDDDTIWFWDRENPETRKQLGDHVYDFLDKLHYADPSKIEVPEGTKVTHLDPEFRDEQRRRGNLISDD